MDPNEEPWLSPYLKAKQNSVVYKELLNGIMEWAKVGDKRKNYSKANQTLKNLTYFRTNPALLESLLTCKWIP
jgi:hypothetical protein